VPPSPFDQLREAAFHSMADLRAAGKVMRRGRVIKAVRLCLRARLRLENVLRVDTRKEAGNEPS
jgi:hypothetical protein